MTAPAVTPRKQYTADGTVGPLVIPWPFYDDDDLLVYDGETSKTRTTEYTLTGAGEPTGGELTWVSGSQPTSGATVTIIRQQVSARDSDLPTAGTWRAAVVNTDLDYIISGLQDLLFKSGLAIRVSPAEGSGLELPGVAARANKHFAFDGTGEISLTTNAPISELKYTETPITLAHDTASYALPVEVQSGLDEDNYAAWVVGGDRFRPGTDFTVTSDTITFLTTPTTTNGMAGQSVMVELIRPAINASAVQPRTVVGNAIALEAILSEHLGFPGQANGDILIRSGGDWIPFAKPGSDGKYTLGVDVSGGTATYGWKNRAPLLDWSFPAFYTTPYTVIGTVADDDNKMMITEGDEIMTRSITIDDETQAVIIFVDVRVACAIGAAVRIGLFRDGVTDALREARYRNHVASSADAQQHVSFVYMAAGITAGAVTYSVRVGCTDTTGRVNDEFYAAFGTGRKGGGNLGCSMFIAEVGSKT